VIDAPWDACPGTMDMANACTRSSASRARVAERSAAAEVRVSDSCSCTFWRSSNFTSCGTQSAPIPCQKRTLSENPPSRYHMPSESTLNTKQGKAVALRDPPALSYACRHSTTFMAQDALRRTTYTTRNPDNNLQVRHPSPPPHPDAAHAHTSCSISSCWRWALACCSRSRCMRASCS
jgi:hypothetical protein